MINLELTDEEFKMIKHAVANSIDKLMKHHPEQFKSVMKKFTELLKRSDQHD